MSVRHWTWIRWAGMALSLLSLSTVEGQEGGPSESTSDAEASMDEDRTARARAAYEEGASAFEGGRFAEALDRFAFAYELSARAELLYNIGASHDRLGHRESALRAYQDYLQARPDAHNEAYTRARIEVLEREVAEESAAAEAAESVRAATPAPMRTPPEPAPRRVPAGGVALLAGGGAALVAGAITGALALRANNDLEARCPEARCPSDARSDVDRLDRLSVSTDVLLAVGAAAAVAGFVWIVATPRGDVEVALGPRSLNVRAEF